MLEAILVFLLLLFCAVVVLPTVVFLSVKLGTYAYLIAHRRFEEKENRNGS